MSFSLVIEFSYIVEMYSLILHLSLSWFKGTVSVSVTFHLLRGMYNSQRYPLNLCPDKNLVDAGRLEVTVYTALSVHCTLVYTRAVSWHYINKNIWYPWSNKGLKGIVVNRTFHSKNWRSLEITRTVPLCSSEILILVILCRFLNLTEKNHIFLTL